MPGERQGIEHEPAVNPDCITNKIQRAIDGTKTRGTIEADQHVVIYKIAFKMLKELNMDTRKACPETVLDLFFNALDESRIPDTRPGDSFIDNGKVLSAVAAVYSLLR